MLVISAKSGQLGNRLLLFANFIAFAIEKNLKVLNPAFEEYAEFFQSTATNFLCCYPSIKISIASKLIRNKYYNFNRYLAEKQIFNTITIARDKPFNWSNLEIANQLKPGRINLFQGWLFRDGWFVADTENLQKHAQEIRAYFTPLEKYQLNVDKLISKIRSEAEILIGVHIRLGDYQQHQGGRYFYTFEEYRKVMESAEKLFPNKKVIFLICSNVENEKQPFAFHHYWGNNHIIEDMYSLAQCDYILGPPSSYTMWASFYGDRPLYMIRDVNKVLQVKDFVHFYEWQGIFHYRDNWSESFWEWTQ